MLSPLIGRFLVLPISIVKTFAGTRKSFIELTDVPSARAATFSPWGFGQTQTKIFNQTCPKRNPGKPPEIVLQNAQGRCSWRSREENQKGGGLQAAMTGRAVKSSSRGRLRPTRWTPHAVVPQHRWARSNVPIQ